MQKGAIPFCMPFTSSIGREGGWVAGRVILCRSPTAAPPYVHRPTPSRGPATAHPEAGGGHACGRRQVKTGPHLCRRSLGRSASRLCGWVIFGCSRAGGAANRPKRAREDGVSYGRDAPATTLTAARLAPSSQSLAVAACVAVVLQAVHSVLLLLCTEPLFPPHPPGRLGDASGREGVNRMDRGVLEQGLPLLQDGSIMVTVVGG